MAQARPEMRHDRLWAAIDALAMRNGLSPSGLARRAGLDATAFNKSKRFTGDGRPRWPSTESIAKILAATGTDLDDLVGLINRNDDRLPTTAIPSFLGGEGVGPGFRDDAAREATVAMPDIGPDAALQAVRIDGDGMLPLYREGDVLIVSARAEIRPGDRVLVQIEARPHEARIFLERDGEAIDFGRPLDGDARERVRLDRIRRLVRIVWASQ